MRTRALVVVVAVVATAVLTLGAAGPSAASGAPKKKAPVCAGKTKKTAVKDIKKAYDTLFNGSLPLTLDQKFAAVEGADDPEFLAVLKTVAEAQAAMLTVVNAKVNKVTCAGKKTADVTWDLILSGQVAAGLAPPGSAVLEGKQWVVAQTTVCDLFALADPTLVQSGPCADIAAGG
jgi:hypothetical protein